MSKTKSKFERQLSLSHKEIKGKRAKMFTKDAVDSSVEYIRDLKKKKRIHEKDLMNLEDLSPSSTVTLNVTKEGFNTDSWIKAINEAKFNLMLIEPEIQCAIDIHKEYFGELESDDDLNS